tara:strand:- start:158 stop:550 length:393 start_codon:yes stop_codon:yes gene_type:complete
MKKQKAKAVNAVLRKESKNFKGYLKYEVTIENEDGTTEVVPAYGKDLQDALSRVVHDRKIEKIIPVVNKVPDTIWAFGWFLLFTLIVGYITTKNHLFGDWVGVVYIGIIALTTALSLAVTNFFTLRNKNK